MGFSSGGAWSGSLGVRRSCAGCIGWAWRSRTRMCGRLPGPEPSGGHTWRGRWVLWRWCGAWRTGSTGSSPPPGPPASAPKRLPPLATVVELVRSAGGVTSAAHLSERADPQGLQKLKGAGVDAVEVVHPAHDSQARRRIETPARRAGLLVSGGSDWHGDTRVAQGRAELGALTVPAAWEQALRAVHQARTAGTEVVR